MTNRQKVIVDWMQDIMTRHDISATAWAVKAKLGRDTVARVFRPGHRYMISMTTLIKLAESVGETLPNGMSDTADDKSSIPSVESLELIVRELHLAILGSQAIDEVTNHLFAVSLRDTLLHLEAEPEAHDDPKLSAALARAAVRQRRP